MTDFIDAETGEVIPGTEDNIIVAFAQYQHEAAKQEHWVRHRYLTEAQKKGIKARLSEAGGMAAWREAIDLASRSEFLTGKIPGKSGRFKLDLNFLIRPSSFAKILDKFYTRDEGPITTRLTLPTLQTPAQRPAEPFKHDIETPEDRMAFTISAYRLRGKWADANRVEEKLAAIQKRPAVLVPASDMAFASSPGNQATRRETPDTPHPAQHSFKPPSRPDPVDLDWQMMEPE